MLREKRCINYFSHLLYKLLIKIPAIYVENKVLSKNYKCATLRNMSKLTS